MHFLFAMLIVTDKEDFTLNFHWKKNTVLEIFSSCHCHHDLVLSVSKKSLKISNNKNFTVWWAFLSFDINIFVVPL